MKNFTRPLDRTIFPLVLSKLPMPTDQQLTMRLEGISASEWNWVHRLIADVQEQEQREHLIALWAQWRMAVRIFRQVEFSLMRQKTPSESDYSLHRACLAALMSIGEFLLNKISDCSCPDDLRKHGFNREDAQASLATLRANWDEWHSDVSKNRMQTIQQKLQALNGTAQAH